MLKITIHVNLLHNASVKTNHRCDRIFSASLRSWSVFISQIIRRMQEVRGKKKNQSNSLNAADVCAGWGVEQSPSHWLDQELSSCMQECSHTHPRSRLQKKRTITKV